MQRLFILTFAFVLFTSQLLFSQLYILSKETNSFSMKLFSKAPIENIEAINHSGVVVVNGASNDIQISVTIGGFKFPKPLMEEHFNENYMESEKYPKAIFKGKINEKIDWTHAGESSVTVHGKMEIHGVTKEVTLPGTITVLEDGTFKIHAFFIIKPADYNVKIPSMYVKNIAEEIEMTVDIHLEIHKKNK